MLKELFCGVSLLIAAARGEVVGYYSWNWGSGSTGPANASIGVAFTGLNNVSQAISGYPPNATWCCPPLKGQQYISLGGGNAAGIMDAAVLADIASDATLKQISSAGYTGVVFDVEEVQGGASSMVPAFASTFEACKAHGLAVVVTTSHSAPYQTDSPSDAVALVKAWAQDANIDVLSPQLYSSGQEAQPDFDTTSSCSPACSWQLYQGMKPKFAPSIVAADQLEAVQKYFQAINVPVDGFFEWKQIA